MMSGPDELAGEILEAAAEFEGAPLAVRSSAPAEDSGARSFAGLHESVLGVTGEEALLVAFVWSGRRSGPTPRCCTGGSSTWTRRPAGWRELDLEA